MIGLLHLAARYGRVCLVAGLVCGLTLPGLAGALRPWLPELIAALLALTAFRIGPRAALGGLGGLRRTAGIVAIYQLALPLAALALFSALGVAQYPLAVAVTLMLAAPSVTGAPNFAILLGHDPAPALRLLVLGTAVFPLTVLPVLWLSPALGAGNETVEAAMRLLAVIGGAVGLGFFIRHIGFHELNQKFTQAVDGAAAILLGVVVVGLMAALGPALATTPWRVAAWLVAVVAVNFGLQIAAARVLGHRSDMPGHAIAAGNRNIALFLLALPPETTDPLLIFIGCYQVPMYLTPIALAPLYQRRGFGV